MRAVGGIIIFTLVCAMWSVILFDHKGQPAVLKTLAGCYRVQNRQREAFLVDVRGYIRIDDAVVPVRGHTDKQGDSLDPDFPVLFDNERDRIVVGDGSPLLLRSDSSHKMLMIPSKNDANIVAPKVACLT